MIPRICTMDFEYTSLPTADLLDILTKNTMRYNQILISGPTDEVEMLREAIILLQKEVEKRKESEE